METPAHPLSRKPGYRLALAGCVLAVLVVGLGAFTRLVDAGLGCPDWPGCYGHILWPEHAHEIAAANAAFPHAPVETHKTWPEQVHRLFASSLGLVVLGLFFVALRHRDRRLPVASMLALLAVLIVATVGRVVKGDVLDPYLLVIVATYFLNLLRLWWLQPAPSAQPLRLPALLAGAVILQGLFGMWTVTLKLWPQVVTGHLLGGFTILSLLWLLSLRLGNRPWRVDAGLLVRLRALRPWVFGGLVIVVVQIALGGWMTSNYADVACPDLPRCQARWWPPMDFAQGFNVFQEVGPNYLGGQLDNAARVAIHMAHRIGALVTSAYLIFLALRFYALGAPFARRAASGLLAVLILQVCLGLSNVLFRFPVDVAVAHNLGGALLLLSLVTLCHRVVTAGPSEELSHEEH